MQTITNKRHRANTSSESESQSEHESDSGSESGEDVGQFFDSPEECAADKNLCARCPTLDASLVGQSIAFRWNCGWEHGVITKHLLKTGKQNKKNTTSKPNFEVHFDSDSAPRDSLLIPERYAQSFTSAGAWRIFSEQ